MSRIQIAASESVADLFRVSTARARRRQVRLRDVVDWELLTEILDATRTRPSERWPEEPLDGLIQATLARTRGQGSGWNVAGRLRRAVGDWALLVREGVPAAVQKRLGLAAAEVGHLRTMLRLVARRFNSLTLAPLADMPDDRAVRELTALPGVDLATACTVLLRCFRRRILPPTPAVRRVLVRMGIVPSGATDMEVLSALRRIPKGVPVATLLEGLTDLASRTCLEDQPGCERCPLRKLCAFGRRTLHRAPTPETLTFVDLFAGAGGMSAGLIRAGLAPLLALDIDSWACETYRLNHPEVPPERILVGDIREIDPSEASRILGDTRPDLVVGGPPCQGFSMIGKRGRSRTRFTEDPRNRLYNEFVRWVTHLRPRFVVMENVPGLFSYADGACREDIERSLQEAGYAVSDLLVDASRFGVPQRRQRVLFIGVSTTDFGDTAAVLSQRITELLQAWREPQVTLRQAIGDLPPLEPGEGREATLYRRRGRPSRYAVRMGARRTPVLYHHAARPVNLRDLLLYTRLKPGEKGRDAVEQDARHLMVYRNDVFQDKYRRLRYDEPCPTIMSHLAKDGHMFIHPDPKQRRSLTVREAARVQSFPDDFIFRGPRTHQFTQVGNAVPPLLAQAIGEAIRQALVEAGRWE